MDISRQLLVFDAPDLEAESSFWAALLGGSVDDPDDDWHTVYVAGQPRVAVQLAPDLIRSSWPDRSIPQQMHLDLYVDDIRSAHDEVVGLGATLLQAADNLDAADGFQVYTDPAGHPFCLCWG